MPKKKTSKTIEEINRRIKQGKVVVITADEMTDIVKLKGAEKAAREVDVVTTGTFAPMCSSGAFINFGHTKPATKASEVWLNNVLVHPFDGGVTIDRRNSSRHRHTLTPVLSGRWMKVRPEIIPAVTQDSGPDMSDGLSTFRIPAHARLVDATAHDLFDSALGRATADLKPLLDV